MVDEFIQWLSAQNWKVIPAETATPIPEDVLSRYGHAIPQSETKIKAPAVETGALFCLYLVTLF